MAATDAQLVRGALDGSEAAFHEIVGRYQRAVFGVIARVVRDRARAEELAQDAFVKAFRALHTYDPQRRLATWLLTIAHRVAIDEVRRRVPEMVSVDALDADLGSRELRDDVSPTPAALAERAELAEALQAAIARLRPEYRAVMSLRYEQEMDLDEIAGITGLPLGTVKSSLYRARKELAMMLDGWGR